MVSSINGGSYRSLRIGGLASGLETEEIIEKLISNDKHKVDSLKADKQLAVWQQEAYHEIRDILMKFKDDYFNVLDSKNNMLSSDGSKKVALSNAANDFEKYIDIIANGEAVNGKYVINEIKQIAKVSSTQSSAKCSGVISGTVDLNSLTYPLDYSGDKSKGFIIVLDGVMREINLDKSYADSAELVNDLNSNFDSLFGNGRIQASISAGNTLELTADNSVIQVVGLSTGENFLDDVGIESGDRNLLNIDRSAEKLFDETEEISFKINGKSFTFDKSTSIRNIMDEINASSDANVTMTYSALTDKFTLESNDTGASSTIKIENISGNFFGATSYINITDTQIQNGQDAVLFINDESKTNAITRSSNVFTIDGVTYSLKEETTQAIEYNIESNTEGVYEKISNFVKSFNEMINKVHEEINEKKDSDYYPLSEEEKEEMSEKQIELWEEKAKNGILKRDSILMKIEDNLRNAFYDRIEGVSTSFKDIGITLPKEDHSKFELIIDETKLKEEITKNPNRVMQLFKKEEDIKYRPVLSSEDRAQRYKEVGFAQRVSDIIMDNVRTSRNKYGNKGMLLEKAGLAGDASQTKNILYERIEKIEKSVKVAIERMQNKEDRYWQKFSAMEAAIQRMNAQSEWLYSQFSQ